MAQQRRGLGKGLGALIPEAPRTGTATLAGTMTGAPVPVDIIRSDQPAGTPAAAYETPDTGLRQVAGAYFEEVAVGSITPNPRQPRRTFDEEALEELAASITEVGLLQPVVVRKLGEGNYELVMGERRWRASQRAGLEYIPAIVRETPDTDMLRDALLENLHRQQLDPLEEAAAYQQLLDDFGATHEQLAQKVGRSRPHISNTLRLLNLPPGVQKRVAAGVLSAGHARRSFPLTTRRPRNDSRSASWTRDFRFGRWRRSFSSGRTSPRSSPAGPRPPSRLPRRSATCPTGSPTFSRPA